MRDETERVHVVFKTHLDIGFTDLASAVTERYFRVFIPKAIETAREMRRRGRDRFIWTTGSWLVSEFLSRAGDSERAMLEEAIAAGDIVWHALPFTTHTELMDPALADYGLSLSTGLDKRFGRKTIAAKFTDVPGHTIGIVPLLARRGVRYLHIGVNGGSSLPRVPPLFRWKAAEGGEVIVQYSEGYGDRIAIKGFSDALAIVNSSDNSGPPRADEVERDFERIRSEFPGARVFASTLDAFAEKLSAIGDRLPVLTEEIGDTWIHGVGTDPAKVARLRELLRLRTTWEKSGKLEPGSAAWSCFMGNLLMVPEHTWGLDFKKYLGDYRNWAVADFAAARAKDVVAPDAVPPSCRHIADFAEEEFLHLHPDGADRWAHRTYSFFESSHREQRAYIDKAVSGLDPKLRAEAESAIASLEPQRPAFSSAAADRESVAPGERIAFGRFSAVFGADGAVLSLIASSGKELALQGCGIGVFRYESFGPEEYAAWHRDYNRDMGTNASWALADFGKPGIEFARPRPEHRLVAPILRSLRVQRSADADIAEAVLGMPDAERTAPGAPGTLVLRFRAPHGDGALSVALDWFDKPANRLPEALWLSVGLNAGIPSRWRMVKLASEVSPLDVVLGGNRSYHAVQALRYRASDGEYEIRPLDSPIVSPGARSLLRYDGRFADLSGGMHFNLYNNLWGTNFPMWYGEDGRSRIEIDGL